MQFQGVVTHENTLFLPQKSYLKTQLNGTTVDKQKCSSIAKNSSYLFSKLFRLNLIMSRFIHFLHSKETVLRSPITPPTSSKLGDCQKLQNRLGLFV